MAMLIRTRRECGEIGAGTHQVIDTGNDAILGLRYNDGNSAIVVLNNLSPDRHTIALDVTEDEIATATGLVGDRRYEPMNPKSKRIRMDGFGYRWLRMGGIY